MKVKSFKFRLFMLAILAALCVTIALISSAFVAGAEELTEPPEAEVTETVDDGSGFSVTDIFYDKILPVIVNVASGAGVFLVALFPLIKALGSRNTYRAAYSTAVNEVTEYKGIASDLTAKLKELSERFAEISQIDYKALIKETVGADLEIFKSAIKSEIEIVVSKLTSTLIEDVAERQLQAERLDKLIASAMIVWGGAEGVTELLTAAPSATVLKREALRNLKLEEIIAQIKGEEAEKIIAEVDAAVGEVV